MTRRSNRTALLLTVSAAALASLTVGCSSNSAQAYRNNPTPKMHTLGETKDDVNNQIAVTGDTNGRALNQDLGRMWFSDRPSRLTPGPKPY